MTLRPPAARLPARAVAQLLALLSTATKAMAADPLPATPAPTESVVIMSLFQGQVDASALGIPGLRSTRGVDAKLKLDYRPTARDLAQLSISRTDRRLTARLARELQRSQTSSTSPEQLLWHAPRPRCTCQDESLRVISFY